MSAGRNTPMLTNGRPRDSWARASTRERADQAIQLRLKALLNRLRTAAPTSIGFPAAVDIDYRPLAPTFAHLLNNVGDPDIDPTYPGHAKDLERDVVTFFGDLFRAPPDRFGYVTSGGSESNLYALYLARSRYPDGLVLHSAAAHYSVAKAAHLLAMPTAVVGTLPNGEIDYDDLRVHAATHRDRPVIVVACIGTTMTEAVDDVHRIHQVLDDVGVTYRYVHSDAALAGIPLALTPRRPGFDLADGADSIAVSGHKFLGTPTPCGVVVARRHHADHLAHMVAYTGSPDSTITGSRSGHAALMLWWAIHHHGTADLQARAEQGRQLAAYACDRLQRTGWTAWRNPHALTVMLRPLPPELSARWPLATADGWSHLICMPGITREQIDAFIGDLKATLASARSGAGHTATDRPSWLNGNTTLKVAAGRP